MQLKNSVVLEEDRQALETMIRSVSKAHQQAKKLQESLTSQCGKMEQESLQRRQHAPIALLATPSVRCKSRVELLVFQFLLHGGNLTDMKAQRAPNPSHVSIPSANPGGNSNSWMKFMD